LILLRPREEARSGVRFPPPPPPASLSCCAAAEAPSFLASAAEGLEVAEEAALLLGEGTGMEVEPKSLSRFLGVSDLGFFLSDLEEEEAGEAAEEAPGAEVGVRGLLLPSGLEAEESEDLWREEKKRPLKTIAAGHGG
jgi:hypothetical protein